MNRAERRREAKMGINQSTIMERYRKEAYDAGYMAGMTHEIEVTFSMLAYTLSYKTDFSDEKIKELLRTTYLHIDSFRTHQLEIEDYDTICNELKEKGLSLSEIMKTIE